ncbi:MAG: hypothetical protein ACP5M7_08245 [Thermoproteota archaeon]
MKGAKLTLDKHSLTLGLISGLASLFYGLYLLFVLFLPIYTVDGIITGYVGLLHYNLNYYGKPLRLDSFSAVSLFSIPLLAYSFFSMSVGLLAVYNYLKKKDMCASVRRVFGSSLAGTAMSGLLFGLLNNVLPVGVGQLNINLNTVTSAGYVYLGSATVRMLPLSSIVASNLVILGFTLLFLFISSLAYIVFVEKLKV